MNARLVLIHGRSQEHKDAATLKQEWLGALRRGLDQQGLNLTLGDDQVRFPYYGDTLNQLVHGVPGGQERAEVIVRGMSGDPAEQQFVAAVLEETRIAAGVTDEDIRAAGTRAETGTGPGTGTGDAVLERGLRPQGWMLATLRALDERVPGAGAPILALATRDVYQYLRNPGFRDVIETGVRQAFAPGGPTVVVGHSLGTVIAYNLLRREATRSGWQVPLLLTLGSPLGLGAIRTALAPLQHPPTGAWLNAADPRDVVALWPLEPPHFTVNPPVENWIQVSNHTENRHGIEVYLDDPVVARRLHTALTGE